jgi:hypothetical protein
VLSEKPEKEHVSLRFCEDGISTGQVSYRIVWDKIPVEKHKEKVKHAQVDWRISPLMEPCRACTDRESQQQGHGTQPAHMRE